MTKTLLSALALVLAASCSKSAPTPADETHASQVLQALSSRDEERVAHCASAVEACTQRELDVDGAACTKLSEHCASLQERLEQVRTPAVGCWRAVQECAAHTPEQAQCQRDPAECESVQQAADAERTPVVECSARVEACLLRVAELPEAAAVSCENIAAACERAAAADHDGADAGKGRDDRDDEDNEDENGDANPHSDNPRHGPRNRADAGVAAEGD